MKNFTEKFFKVCPRSGKIRGIKRLEGLNKFLFPLIGLIALLWVLFRVVTKPTRINYPCVQAATPFATGFIAYIGVLIASFIVFLKTKKRLFLSPHLLSIGLLLCGFGGTYFLYDSASNNEIKLSTAFHEANVPMGIGQGIFPGRVVWVHNPDATNENCIPNKPGQAWWIPENNNQEVIDKMVSDALKEITGEATNADAWDAIFKFHNNTRGKGSVVYAPGEKIFIKINNVSGWGGNYSNKDLSVVANGSYGISETSPQIVLSVLRQLVNVVGVEQSDIYVGDPLRNTYKHCYDMWYAEFPNVHYVSNGNFTSLGRERVVKSTTAKIVYSDKGSILRENVWDVMRPGGAPIYDDYFYKQLEKAEYLINLPMFKAHKRAGVTAFAKNHFGSHTRGDAAHLHNGLPAPRELQNGVTYPGYGHYRVLVDLMMHELTGKKNLLYLADMLWSTEYEIAVPVKFEMAPFNNDWTSSIFVSLDPVAIESVAYDILRTEFTSERGLGTYPQMDGVDDYLHQAADSTNWPEGIKYDPNNNGAAFVSLGVHEHWNNSVDMKYSRNLGGGEGIELIRIDKPTSVEHINGEGIPSEFVLMQNYPNPFNPETIINYQIPNAGHVTLKVYDVLGKEISVLVDEYQNPGLYQTKFFAGNNGSSIASGVYIYNLQMGNYSISKKMILMQ